MSNLRVVSLTLAAAAFLALLMAAGCTGNLEKAGAPENSATTIPVHVAKAARRTFEDRIFAQGNLFAKNSAMVTPLIDGTITDFYVDEGDPVKANETPLFQIDKVKVERAAAIAEQDLAMAHVGLTDAEAQRTSVEAQYEKARLDFERYTRLFNQKAITPDAMEKVESGYKVASAGMERARAGVAAAAERVKQAESALSISRKTLADSKVYAPINGVVSMRLREPGEFGPAGVPLVKIVDPSLLELSAFIPGEYYPKIVPGQTQVRVSANGMEAGSFVVSFKSPEIQPTLRTFEVKCLIENPPDGVVPGALANLNAVLTAKEGVGVPTHAIQRRGNKDVVFTVVEGKAGMLEVTRGIDADGWTEITSETVQEGMPIVTMGQFLVNDGTAVTVREENI